MLKAVIAVLITTCLGIVQSVKRNCLSRIFLLRVCLSAWAEKTMFMCWVVIVAEKCDANLFSDNPCFARTRSCQYQQRLPRVQNGAALFVVERDKIGRIIRRVHLLIVAEMRGGVSRIIIRLLF